MIRKIYLVAITAGEVSFFGQRKSNGDAIAIRVPSTLAYCPLVKSING